MSTCFSVATPGFLRLAVEAVGKRGAGSAPRKVNVWRLPSAPPVVLPDRRGPRGGLCRCGGAAKRARASDENFQPRFRHATGPAPPPSLIPGAHQVPVKAMPEIMRRGGKGVDKEISFSSSRCWSAGRMRGVPAWRAALRPAPLIRPRLRFAPARPPSPTRGRRRGAISALRLISNGGDWPWQ